MIELTATHGDIWGDSIPRLVFVISEVIKNTQFDDATRTAALEIISTLAENMAGILRREAGSLKDHFFPALAQMMTEVEHADDVQAWYKEEDTEL